jgi:hypothetical protein
MASRRSTPPTRARAMTGRDKLESPTAGIERFLRTSVALQETLSIEQQLAPLLDAVAESAARPCEARDAVIFRVDGEAAIAATPLPRLRSPAMTRRQRGRAPPRTSPSPTVLSICSN